MLLNKENIKKIMLLITFTILILVGLQRFDAVLSAVSSVLGIIFPFALGASLAFILNVPMHFLEKNLFENKMMKNHRMAVKMARPLSLILTLLLVVAIIAIVIFVVVPELGTTVISLGASIQDFIPKVQEWAEKLFQDNQSITAWIGSMEFDWEKMIQSGIDFLKTGAGSFLNSTFIAAKTIVSGIANFFIAFVFACYILLQKERLHVQVKKVLYALIDAKLVKQALAICTLTYKTFSNFLTGQVVEAVILGTMFFIVMTVIRLPYAMLVGVLIAFTALIPIFGAFIGCVIGAFLILMVNPMQALIFVIVFLVLQQLEGNFIYPYVVGNSVGLPSIWVLVAVSLGASLMGIVGMLIFIPLTSVMYTLFRAFVYKRLEEKKVSSGEIFSHIKEE